MLEGTRWFCTNGVVVAGPSCSMGVRMEFRYVKLETFVPESHAEAVLAALWGAGAGRVGDGAYDSCATTSQVTGHWRPLAGSHPFIGREGEFAHEPEIKIEVTVPADLLDASIAALRAAHPYEEPVVYALPLLVP